VSQAIVNISMTGVFIILGGLLTLAEMAIISSRKTKLQELADKGIRGANSALKLANSPTEFLATVQTGITIIGLAAGAFSGVTLGEQLSQYLIATFPTIPVQLAHFFGASIVVFTVGFITITVGELLPKRLALIQPEVVACYLSKPLQILATLTKPFTQVLSTTTENMLKVLGFDHHTREEPVTENEMRILIDEASKAGVVDASEGIIMKRAMRLGDIKVNEIMTPRTQVIMISLDDHIEESIQTIISENHSYYPAFSTSMDHPQGFISTKLLLKLLSENGGKITSFEGSLIPNALYLPEALEALEALERFKANTAHIAMVIDEYGGFAGILSIIDIMEAIVGEVSTQFENEGHSIIRRVDGSWLIDGLTLLDNMEELTQLKQFIDRDESDIQTIGGFVMHKLGRIPKEADLIEWQGLVIEVVDMDGNRVDKVLINEIPEPKDDGY
jgi:putative hemolysin